MFKIEDWAGNTMFSGKRFKTFEDGWEYIYEQLPDANEEDLGEYYVLEA